jgi:hypothetical protein
MRFFPLSKGQPPMHTMRSSFRTTLRSTFSTLMIALGLISPAQAHQIWLEQAEGGEATVRFGEFGDNLRETSPGLLDRFQTLSATRLSSQGEHALTPVKAATGFDLATRVAPGESLIAEDAAFPIRVSEREGQTSRSWYRPAARLIADFSTQTPKLTLDIVPTGKAGAFKVTFQGKPLPKAEVQILVQSGWSKKARANAEGLVQFDLPWQGQSVLETSHNDRNPGERQGEAYDAINYVTTLTLTLPTGIPPLPAGPAATPNGVK